jgi:hypothetical protein
MVPETIRGSPGSVAETIEIFHGAFVALSRASEGCANKLPPFPQADDHIAPTPASGKTIAAFEAY